MTGLYPGFDKNVYPGDELMSALQKKFAFTGYWLNNPPGMTTNGWLGKRTLLRGQGYGFVVLFNGRLYADLQAGASAGRDPAEAGRSDAAHAAAAAHREGFPAHAIVYLDQEEGGHLLPEQAAYLFAWIDAIARSGYRAGVYCSGIAVGVPPVTTAGEVEQHYRHAGGRASRRPPAIWVANDQCPPAPGCTSVGTQLRLNASGTSAAVIWQFAQSPRRAEFTSNCASSYAPDNQCYAPGLPHSTQTAIDLDAAASPDPSHGR